MNARHVANILGVAVERCSFDEALQQATEWLMTRHIVPAHIVTANPEMIMKALDEPALKTALDEADLVVPDGQGVVWASRLLGCPVPHRIAGIDLTSALLEQAALRRIKVFFLGAKPGVAHEAATKLQECLPGLQVGGTHHGFFSEDESETIVQLINTSGSRLLLVAMGVPRQELWIARHRKALQVGVAIGVGGAFDVFAGRTKRAPVLLQRFGLEWAYRAVRQPSRIRRLGALPRFAMRTMLAAWRKGR